MPADIRLVLFRSGAAVHELVLDAAGVRVGRAPENELVLTDGDISWNHAAFWSSGSTVYVRDRGSTNGTFVNGWRAHVPLPVSSTDVVRLGANVELRVIGGISPAGERPERWLVEDVERGLCVPWVREAHGLLSGDPPEVGRSFLMDGRTYRVLGAASAPVATAGTPTGGWPYRLRVRIDAPTGPEAVVEHRTASRRCQITAENRVILLYILGRRVLEDQRARRPQGECGWCPDEEVITGIWGREGANMDSNGLHVLLHRVRRELSAAELDPGFLEKRGRSLRLSLLDVCLE